MKVLIDKVITIFYTIFNMRLIVLLLVLIGCGSDGVKIKRDGGGKCWVFQRIDYLRIVCGKENDFKIDNIRKYKKIICTNHDSLYYYRDELLENKDLYERKYYRLYIDSKGIVEDNIPQSAYELEKCI